MLRNWREGLLDNALKPGHRNGFTDSSLSDNTNTLLLIETSTGQNDKVALIKYCQQFQSEDFSTGR